jgi:aldose 1-epimerase
VLELRAGSASATVDPDDGGRLVQLSVGDLALLTDDGSFVMAPWAGRTGHGRFTWQGAEHRLPVPEQHAPHAIHGTVRGRPWTVVEVTPTSTHLSIDLGPDWPWPGRCEQRIELGPDRIRLELEVHSDGPSFPAVVGWHPWFTKPDAVDLQASSMRERGADHLPTGRLVPPPAVGDRPLDDCFHDVTWPVVLQIGGPSGFTVSIDAEGCDDVVVYDEQAQATCIEPQTGPPNGLATGDCATVTPDSPLAAATTWRWAPTVGP